MVVVPSSLALEGVMDERKANTQTPLEPAEEWQ